MSNDLIPDSSIADHTLDDINDFNNRFIAEFRANAGKVGGVFAGAPMILVHHKGARSGTQRVTPLTYQKLGDSYAVFASAGGAPTNPQWLANLVAHPDTTVEVGTDTITVRARVATGTERDTIFATQKNIAALFADYEKQAAPRIIPVVVLDPIP